MNKNLESTIEKRTKELHKKQVELTHASRLASLGELATGIAHELGQPLQIIQTASRIIQDESASRTNELHEIIPFTNDILEQVERASAIIRNMRAYARHDQTNAVENIDLSVPLKQCLIFFVEQFHQHQIDLTVEIEEDLPKVLVTAQKFQQIVVNLLSNARHAVDEQFRLAADAKKQITVRLYAEPDNNNVFLAVQDNGIGMGEFALQRCLDPFYTTKEMTEGTGLGLSITHDLIEEFGFSLKIKSKPGEGSLFTIAMPVLAPLNTDGDNEV